MISRAKTGAAACLLGGAIALPLAAVAAPSTVPGDIDAPGGVALAGFNRFVAPAVASAPDGRIVVAGLPVPQSSSPRVRVVRLLRDGTVDRSFGARGAVTVSLPARTGLGLGVPSVIVGADGTVSVAGQVARGGSFSSRLWVVRLRATGTADPHFGHGGRVVVDGPASRSFTGGWEVAEGLAAAPGGGLTVAATSFESDPDRSSGPRPQSRALLVRLRADGRLDPRFGAGGKLLLRVGRSLTTRAKGLASLPHGRLAVSLCGAPTRGRCRNSPAAGGAAQHQLLVAGADGAADRRFGSGGRAPARGSGPVLAGRTGRLLVIGADAVSAFTPAGAQDLAFASRGVAALPAARYYGWHGALDRAGRLFLADAQKTLRLSADGARDPSFPDHRSLLNQTFGPNGAEAAAVQGGATRYLLAGGRPAGAPPLLRWPRLLRISP